MSDTAIADRPTCAIRAATAGVVLGLVGAVLPAQSPEIHAIRGARIVTAAGDPIPSGTVILRGGRIDAVGSEVTIPREARVIDGSGLTVYPGIISATRVDVPVPAAPASPPARDDVERWKRSVLLRPHIDAAGQIDFDAGVSALAAAGITSVLAIPGGDVIAGRSAFVNVVPPGTGPQIGNLAADSRSLAVLKAPVALHVNFTARPRGPAYPQSLLGVVSFVRQAFLDAGHYRLAHDYYAQHPTSPRPEYDQALAALGPAVVRDLPVAFSASLEREIRRALGLAAELNLDPIIAGGLEAARVADDLREAGARVLLSVDYPERPGHLAPDEDEPLRVLRQRAEAPGAAAALDRAGVRFAFQPGDLRNPGQYIRNVAKAVDAGLSPDAAVRALTIDAARIAGVADRTGSIERGKVANLVVTDGDLFAEHTTVRHVFIDGRTVAIDAAAADRRRRAERP